MVGPDFCPPKPPRVKSYTAKPLPEKTARTPAAGKSGKAQVFAEGMDLPGDWWYLFHSPEIDSLVRAGLKNSPNLAAAKAALREAQENLYAQIGSTMFPVFGANLQGQRQRFSAASIGGAPVGSTVFNLFSVNATVSYTFDLFGGLRRQIESYSAQVDYQRYELLAAYLTLTSNIVTNAVTMASIESQIKATDELIKSETDVLELMRKQYQLGAIPLTTILTQETQVEQTRATLPPLQKSLAQTQHALAVLVGDFPNQSMPKIKLDALTLPVVLPVSVPSRLIRQRPDVQASEALLHVASAKIGVATANLLPQFSVSGNEGWQGTVMSSLINPTNKIWSVSGALTQSIFNGGALMATRRAAIAAFDQAGAQYRQTVLQAFQNVADSLRALETDARTLRAQKAAEISARHNLHLTQQQYRLGGVDYLQLLTAQQQYQQTLIARIQAQAARYNDTAALFQALGGGWWNRERPI